MSFKFIQKIINALRLHLSKDVLWEHYKKYKEFEDTKDSVKTLILGSSHGAYGYIAKGDEYNLSLSSQDLYYAYKLYEKYSNLPNLKNIVLFYSVFTNGFVLDKTSEKQRALAYKKLFGIPILHECLYLKLRNYSFAHYLNKVKKRPISHNNGNLEDYKFFVSPEITPELRANQHLKNNLREEKQNIWLEKLINLAEEKNQNVYIVLSPATKEYKACLPNSSELFKDLYNVNGLEKATLINLYDSEMFDSEDFGDLDHLNSKGAEKLSNYVRNLIMK